MTRKSFGVRVAATLTVFLMLPILSFGNPKIASIVGENTSGNFIGTERTKIITPIHKALMTQRGYIQFLRWELPVPEIQEFTFCVWVKSTNLTYPHSIFSYSKNEKERLVRAWISSYGRSVHLEINNVQIFAQPVSIQEHRWYHICESWDNNEGRFALWIDGEKKTEGYTTEMAGHVIPSKGDIVLGQEYTDFDKGLEEGVEGAVLGFNLILASAFDSSLGRYFERNKLEDTTSGFNREIDPTGYEVEVVKQDYGSRNYPRVVSEHPVFDRIPLVALATASQRPIELVPRAIRTRSIEEAQNLRTKRKSSFIRNWEIQSSIGTGTGGKPLGQQLVETTFAQCELGRGSPRIGGKLMLISWTRTPVRVFGGAIIKNAKSDCGQF